MVIFGEKSRINFYYLDSLTLFHVLTKGGAIILACAQTKATSIKGMFDVWNGINVQLFYSIVKKLYLFVYDISVRYNSCNLRLTHFSKIRIDLQNMKINRIQHNIKFNYKQYIYVFLANDFTFTETLYGSPVIIKILIIL